MHLLRTETRFIDEAEAPVDLAQSPAEMVFLSFTDSDLAALAAAWEAGEARYPSLRLASLAKLKHPYSVDLYVESVIRRARFVLVRLLGGLDYWRYGVDELALAARRDGVALAIVPGDDRPDARLDAASTVPPDELRLLWGFFREGGPDNLAQCLAFVGSRLGRPLAWQEPAPVAAMAVNAALSRAAPANAPRALLLFYRSLLMAADIEPIAALADALAERGFAVTAAHVSSLKDGAVIDGLGRLIAETEPDIILNTTAFASRVGDQPSVLDQADAPVLQVILAGARLEAWQNSSRGLGAADLAMNVVLPEIDGRLVTRAISFKAEAERRDAIEFTRLAHRSLPTRVAAVAALASRWVRLRRTPAAERRLALILSDYPHRGGRSGYAVGLDTPASVISIAAGLAEAGYEVGGVPDAATLMRCLTEGPATAALPLTAYRALFDALPAAFRSAVTAAWGEPETDRDLMDGAYRFRMVPAGHLLIALQPDRGRHLDRKASYHDPNLPPCHAYIAFYLWLRHMAAIHALIHCGTHGTLEWLPGKAVALDATCAPEAVLGPVPVVYPFIVNNPGEAAQAKRRIAAVTIGHLTPPLVAAGTHGALAEIEALMDEYADAAGLDPRRARLLADAILARASETGLAADAGLHADDAPQAALTRLDAWLCDVKEMRIGDGLHVFGRAETAARADVDVTLRAACAEGEMVGLVRALDGRFVPPGPSGAPSRGRLDVLPTGRNLFTVDPRAVPTRTAWEIGKRLAGDLVTRYVQDHGDWPKRIVLDLWGSATMRTGGDDLAQALALIGVKPVWDHGSARVSGFTIESPAALGRPRVDVTLRISGLFRDVFPGQIALFDEAVRAVAALDEPDDDNPLAAACGAEGEAEPVRVFGTAPGAYGVGLGEILAEGAWRGRVELGAAYLAASAHAYARGLDGTAAAELFRARVATADAFVHVQDLAEQDVLDADAFATHEGGFAAAAHALGAAPALYHADTTRPERPRLNTLTEEIARVLRGRATNPRWLDGQMRHGHRGAAEIAETVDNLFAFAALTEAVASRQLDLLFEAVCGNERVRGFLVAANPLAARAIAGRFAEARRRDLWQPRRNSVEAILAEMAGREVAP